MTCVGAAVLPQTETTVDAARGLAVHAFLAQASKSTREEALATVPPEYRELCEAIELAELPISAEYQAEVALAYDVETEGVRHLGNNIGRNYGPRGPNEMFLSIDVLGVTPELVHVGDYKTGRGPITPAARNWQLRVAALAACRWLGRSAVKVALVRLNEAGEARWEVASFDEWDLDSFAADLRVLAQRIATEKERMAAGEAARVVLGEHCKYCPAFVSCPAQTALVRRATEAPGEMAHDIKALLTPETASRAFERIRLVQASIKEVWKALFAYAHDNPIQLSDGTVFGPVEVSKEELDAGAVRAVLAAHYGSDIADKACTFDTSKAGVERAMRVVYEQRKQAGAKVTLKALNAEALEAVRVAGGARVRVTSEVKEHRPKDELPGA